MNLSQGNSEVSTVGARMSSICRSFYAWVKEANAREKARADARKAANPKGDKLKWKYILHLHILTFAASLFVMSGGVQTWRLNYELMVAGIAIGSMMDVELDEHARRRVVDAALGALDDKSGVNWHAEAMRVTEISKEETTAPTAWAPKPWAHKVGNYDGVLQIALTGFGPGASEDVMHVIAMAQATDLVQSVLFDLRDNPGGRIDEVRDLAALFLPTDSTVLMKFRRSEPHDTISTQDPEAFPEIEQVGVIINRQSASGSEAFAALVRDHGLGPVVGEVSYGKGSVQTYFNVPGGPPLAVTSARFTGPMGVGIDGVGVIPDAAPETEDGLVTDWDALISETRAQMRASQ